MLEGLPDNPTDEEAAEFLQAMVESGDNAKLLQVTLGILIAHAHMEYEARQQHGMGSPQHREAIDRTLEAIRSCPVPTDLLVHLLLAELTLRDHSDGY